MKKVYKNLVILLSLMTMFFLSVVINYNVFFPNLKSDTISSYIAQLKDDLYMNFYSIEDSAVNYNNPNIETELAKIYASGRFKYIEFKYDRFVFKKDMLLNKFINEKDNYFINNVKVDIKIGEIVELSDNLLEFKSTIVPADPSLKMVANIYNLKEQNDFPINISLNKRTIGDENITFEEEKIMDFFTIKDLNMVKVFKIDNIPFAQVNLFLSGEYIEKIYKDNFYHQVVMPSLASSFIIWLFSVFLYVYLIKNVFSPLKKFEEYTKDIKEKKSLSIVNLDIAENDKTIMNIKHNIEHIVGELFTTNNELTINKDIIESYAKQDRETGFFNYSALEQKFKKMYRHGDSGYVIFVKFNNLSEIKNSHNSKYVNDYVLYISGLLKDAVAFAEEDIKIFKLCSSELIFITKEISKVAIENTLAKIISYYTTNLPMEYKAYKNTLSIGATSFDKYGTIESNIEESIKASKSAKDINKNTIVVSNPEEFTAKYQVLKERVKLLTFTEDFTTSIVSKTISSLDNNIVLMRTFAPSFLNILGEKIEVGTFFSIAEDTGVAMNFDKAHIKKALLQLEDGAHEYEITLSIQSVINDGFIEWIQELLQNNNEVKRLVFSVSAATASDVHFKLFVEKMQNLGLKTMLKRFNELDFKLSDLEGLKIDYIRLSNNITSGISLDAIKHHRATNIIITCKTYHMAVLADYVQNINDLDTIRKIGIEGEVL